MMDGTAGNQNSQYYVPFVEPVETEHIWISSNDQLATVLQISGVKVISDPIGNFLSSPLIRLEVFFCLCSYLVVFDYGNLSEEQDLFFRIRNIL